MKQIILSVALCAVTFSLSAQTKKDGTPDMRYKANKELYGNSYNSSSSNSTPSNSLYNNSSKSNNYYSEPSKKERNYENGGQLKMQDGYMKSNGTYVVPHMKTTPDNKRYNNFKQR